MQVIKQTHRHSYSITAARSTTRAGSAALSSKAAPSSLHQTGPCHVSKALMHTPPSNLPARAHVQQEPLDIHVYDARCVLQGTCKAAHINTSIHQLPCHLITMSLCSASVPTGVCAMLRMCSRQGMGIERASPEQSTTCVISPKRYAQSTPRHKIMHCALPSSVLTVAY